MFGLTFDQNKRLQEFVAAQTLKYSRTFGEPVNLGAIGGELTYEFTPTNLGTVVKVTWMGGTAVETTIDLTNYEDW